MKAVADIKANRLTDEQYQENFCDIEPPLNKNDALTESARCYFCHDAPCIEACPTEIDIPSFIKKIHTENTKGAAQDILKQNILGGSCARACPVEVLCEDACVREKESNAPVKISLLQRYATDFVFDNSIQLFKRQKLTEKHVAVIGSGPAGLSCAHRLAMLGHNVTLYEAKDKVGGLNEYGLAAYKMVDDFAQKEIRYLLDIGGIQIENNKQLGVDLELEALCHDFDAVFMGIGLTKTNTLNLDNESIDGVYDAIDYISNIRQAKNYQELPCPRRAVIIGGGNTAIDIASQISRLGATEVTMAYRRTKNDMGATLKEQTIAKTDGVRLLFNASPKAIHHNQGKLTEVTFIDSKQNEFNLETDMLFKAIGQKLHLDLVNTFGLAIEKNRIKVNPRYQTSIENVFAGGDCITHADDLTVHAVQDGKLAALSIDAFLKG